MNESRLTEWELDVLRFLRSRPASTEAIAAAVLGLPQTNFGRQTQRQAGRLLVDLEARGLVASGKERRSPWRLTGHGRRAIADAFLGLPGA
jgi:hypothetical protein